MTNQEARQAISDFKSKHGTGVRLSKLVKEFSGFTPVYSPRGRASKDPVDAEKQAKARAIETLYQAFTRAIINKKLTLSDEDGTVDFGEVSEYHGGHFRADLILPDYVVELNESFFNFAQALPFSLGGRKTAATLSGRTRSPEAEGLINALQELEKSNGAAAKKFLDVYRTVQAKLRLPKLDD